MIGTLVFDAASANVTNSTYPLKFSRTDGPFGLQELKSVLSFPESNGRSWTLSMQTSDLTAVVLTILILTFAIDHYVFKSRYLVHIGGAKRYKAHAADLDEKALLHEREALKVETGQKPNESGDNDNLLYLVRPFFVAFGGGREEEGIVHEKDKETPGRPATKAEAEGDLDKSPMMRWWRRFVQHPSSQAITDSARFPLYLVSLATLVVFTFGLLLWPMVLALHIFQQCSLYMYFNDIATVPWQFIALKSTFYLAVWTVIGVTIQLKPNRFRAVLLEVPEVDPRRELVAVLDWSEVL
ncbi:hypothetical protein MMC13_008330 [Lambiella insularis]|nr:hypothetical protein [Lambiella insularis]